KQFYNWPPLAKQLLLDEVVGTPILKTGSFSRALPTLSSLGITLRPSPPPLSRSDLVLWPRAVIAVAAQHRHPRLRERELPRTPRERAPACPLFLRIRPSLPRRPGTHRPELDRPAARPPRPQARTAPSRPRNVRKPRFRAACGVTCRLRILRKRPAGAFRA